FVISLAPRWAPLVHLPAFLGQIARAQFRRSPPAPGRQSPTTVFEPWLLRLPSKETDPPGWVQNSQRPRSVQRFRRRLTGTTESGFREGDKQEHFLSLPVWF